MLAIHRTTPLFLRCSIPLIVLIVLLTLGLGLAPARAGVSTRLAMSTSTSTTLTFLAEADARVEEARPSSNYGASYLRANAESGTDLDAKSYLRFTVANVAAPVESAKLRVYAISATVDGPAVYATSNDWSEAGITWSNHPAANSSGLTDQAAIVANSWVEYDVRPVVTGNGTYSFVLATTSTDAVNMASREASGSPQLVLTTAESVPTSTPLEPTATSTPTPTATSAPTSTPTPTATNTPQPTATGTSSVSFTFADEADARVEQAFPDTNYGTAGMLMVDGEPNTESYLRFALSGLSGKVQSAILRLYAVDGSTYGPVVYTSGPNWSETGITWNNRPAPASGSLTTRGKIAANAWAEFDVTAAITGDGVYSFVLAPTSRDGVDFEARETAGNRPELVVTLDSSSPTLPTATTQPSDTTPPTVTISSPAAGTTYTTARTVDIVASVSDDVGVTRVEFYDNGTLKGTEDTEPFSYSWAITSADNGSHSWTARAYDAAGNATSSSAVDLAVSIAPSEATTTPSTITANVETVPVPHSGDAADDAAIWIHPTDPAQSTIIGTDKLGGLAVYDLSGRQLFYYADSQPNNVDLRYNFPLAGQRVTLVTSSNRTDDSIRIYKVNPTTRGLEPVATRTISVGIGIAGLCMYRSPATGKYYVFDGDSSGTVQQWELFDAGNGTVDAKKVRQFSVGSTTEGCVADDELSHFYVAEEDVAIWKYGAEPGTGTTRSQVDAVGSSGHLTADIEGLSIYYATNGPSYIIASSQGSNNYAVYERQGSNAYVMSFAVAAGSLDAVSYTDGLDVTNFALGSTFPEGAFIAQDDKNDGGNQNFKLVPWGQIARSASPQLTIDTTWDPRQVGADTTKLTPTATAAPSATAAPTATVAPSATANPTATTVPTATAAPSATPTTGSTGTTTYYVDSVAGSDSNAGTSESTAWKTLIKANEARLAPGDRLLFKRDGSWTGKLTLTATGNSASPITVGAYGSGNLPVIQGTSSCVVLSGSYLVVREIHATNCSWAGVYVSGSNNRIEQGLMTNNVAGIYVKAGAQGNRILHNTLRDNNRMSVLTESPSDDDSGAFGILLHGDGTEIAYNRISGSDAFSYDYGRDGAAIEIYGGQNNHIHHNLAVDNDAFTELGNSRSANNTFAYNIVRSSLASSVGVVTRGDGSSYGPVLGTRLLNNTIYLTGSASQGFVCHSGCSSDILTMRNNIVQAVQKVGYADAAFDEDQGIFYGGQVQFTMGSRSMVAEPRFVDAASGNLRLQASSPAIDRGSEIGYTQDMDGGVVPIDGNADGQALPDAGAYEYRP